MFDRVGQRLLYDAIRREVHPRWQRIRRQRHLDADGRTGGAYSCDERVELCEPRLGLQAVGPFVVRGGQQAHHVAEFGHGGPTARLDGQQCLLGLLGRHVHHFAGRPGLDHHHAHIVGHDVVQFGGYAGTFFFDGAARGLLLSGLQFCHPVPAGGQPQLQKADEAGQHPCHQEHESWAGPSGEHGFHVAESEAGQRGGDHQDGDRRYPVTAVYDGAVRADDTGQDGDPGGGAADGQCCSQHHHEQGQRIPAPRGQRQRRQDDQGPGHGGGFFLHGHLTRVGRRGWGRNPGPEVHRGRVDVHRPVAGMAHRHEQGDDGQYERQHHIGAHRSPGQRGGLRLRA